MKSNSIISALGGLIMVAGGMAGFIDAFLLGGYGICGGFPLSWGIFAFAALTALLPVGAVGVFSGPWWVPALIYSGPLGMASLGAALSGEWYRCLATAACAAIGFGGAWLFRPRVNQGRSRII